MGIHPVLSLLLNLWQELSQKLLQIKETDNQKIKVKGIILSQLFPSICYRVICMCTRKYHFDQKKKIEKSSKVQVISNWDWVLAFLVLVSCFWIFCHTIYSGRPIFYFAWWNWLRFLSQVSVSLLLSFHVGHDCQYSVVWTYFRLELLILFFF
jgi:hypothetical protein